MEPESPPLPSEADVLESIAQLLAGERSSTLLAHYPTLRIQTNNLRTALISAIESANVVLQSWSAHLGIDDKVKPEFRHTGSIEHAYRVVAPFLVHTLHKTSRFLLDEARPAPAVDVDRVSETTPTFSGFVRLGAAVRAFLDSLVQSSYQLATFDGRQFNYKFLQSMLSFAAVAPPSLHTNVAKPAMQAIFDSFTALSKAERKSSAFSSAGNEQFGQRLRVVSDRIVLPQWQRQNIELLFNFCSDFVHSGYVSLLATGDEEYPSVIVGGPGDAYTPKAENFAELKQRLFAECVSTYADVFLPCLELAIGRTMNEGAPENWTAELGKMRALLADERSILHRRLVEPVRGGLIGSGLTADIQCLCGGNCKIGPPYHEWDWFCPACGSRFDLQEFDDDVDYVISDLGAGDILGGDAPKISSLDGEAKAKLDRMVAKHRPVRTDETLRFLPITDLERCNEGTGAVPSVITAVPPQSGTYDLMAFVAAKALERSKKVRVRCNCGAAVEYPTAKGTNLCTCGQCGRTIGLMGIAGSAKVVSIRSPDGKPGTAPIQARHRFKELGVASD